MVADLKQERDRLGRAIAELEGTKSPRTARKTSVATHRPPAIEAKKRGGLTPEGRRRLSLAMKKRWAERKMRESQSLLTIELGRKGGHQILRRRARCIALGEPQR
jgi:hypothetical protein